MKSKGLFWLLGVAPMALLPLSGGCFLLRAPEPEPVPTPAPTPPAVVFRPEDGQPRGTALNKLNDAVLPDAFRVALALSGDEVVLQTVKKRKKTDGTEEVVLGAPDTNNPVRLAGIVAPKRGQIGYEQSIRTLQNWTAGQDLDVDLDPRYPVDIDNRRMVHIFFKGRSGENQGKLFSLNRMMVRSGYAIVDLHSPTSFNQQEWLFDETYARTKKPVPLGLWPTNVFATLQQRPYTVSRGTGARSNVVVRTAPRPSTSPVQPAARPGTPPGSGVVPTRTPAAP